MWFLQAMGYLFGAVALFLAGLAGHATISSARDKKRLCSPLERIFWSGTMAFTCLACLLLASGCLYFAINAQELVVR